MKILALALFVSIIGPADALEDGHVPGLNLSRSVSRLLPSSVRATINSRARP
jgi:hypothetical protein